MSEGNKITSFREPPSYPSRSSARIEVGCQTGARLTAVSNSREYREWAVHHALWLEINTPEFWLDDTSESGLEQVLLDLGYLSKINAPIADFAPYENRTLVEAEGKPLSEIIVEERR